MPEMARMFWSCLCARYIACFGYLRGPQDLARTIPLLVVHEVINNISES